MRKDRGYYQTANKDIPLNDRGKGEIAPIAFDQLRPYREAAQTWPVYNEMRDGETMGPRWVHACRICTQAIWFNSDENKVAYDYSEEEMLALIIAHIRQCHSKLVTGEEEWPIATT
jgi:hypothetical protein